MDKENNNLVSRKDFLKTAGSTALFATLGIGFVGCSSPTKSDDKGEVIVDNPTNGNGGNGDEDSPILITNNGNTITIDLAADSVSKLNSSGGWLLIAEATTLLVNVDGETIRAFTSVCTHQGCSTDWRFSNSLFECTCHGSRYNTSGAVVRGPASRDLKEFSVSKDGNELVVNK
jgi:cytochrome b6-f complex iron-sulfur subunit